MENGIKKTIGLAFIIGLVFTIAFNLNNDVVDDTQFRAQVDTSQYVPLTDIQGVSNSGTQNRVGDYIKVIYGWGLGIVIVLAIATLIISGLKYMTLESITGKSDAKQKIQAAIIGLLLALSSWLILATINPEIFNASDNTIVGGE